jgi:hypothetical protein
MMELYENSSALNFNFNFERNATMMMTMTMEGAAAQDEKKRTTTEGGKCLIVFSSSSDSCEMMGSEFDMSPLSSSSMLSLGKQRSQANARERFRTHR